MRILLYQARQNEVGGVETFNYNFCKRMSKYYDITFLCDSADPQRLAELSKYVRTVVFDDQYFETDICLYSSCWGKRPEDHIKAKRYIQMVHADFSGIEKHWSFQYHKTPNTTEHWGGGANICKTFENKYGYPCHEIHYLLDDEVEVKPVLKLATISRIAREKGMERIIKFARYLKNNGYKFLWDIWGNAYDLAYGDRVRSQLKDIPEVAFRGKSFDLMSYIANAYDYTVLLSDTEGYAFSIYESLSVNTPVIATSFPNAYEQITDGENGYIVDMELDCLTPKFVEKLYTKIPKFQFKEIASEQEWIKMLGKPDKSRKKTKITLPPMITVKCIRPYTDMNLNRKIKKDTVFQVSTGRAKELMAKNVVVALKVVS